jgi:hypothetical protein
LTLSGRRQLVLLSCESDAALRGDFCVLGAERKLVAARKSAYEPRSERRWVAVESSPRNARVSVAWVSGQVVRGAGLSECARAKSRMI